MIVFASTNSRIHYWSFSSLAAASSSSSFADTDNWDFKQVDFEPGGLVFRYGFRFRSCKSFFNNCCSSFKNGINVFDFNGTLVSSIDSPSLSFFYYEQSAALFKSVFVISSVPKSPIYEFRPAEPSIRDIYPKLVPTNKDTAMNVTLFYALRNLNISAITITVNDRQCLMLRLVVWPVVSCKLPVAVGSNAIVTLFSSGLEVSQAYISFLAPVIIGIEPSEGRTAGGDRIKLNVTNLGIPDVDQVKVYIGSNLCSSATQVNVSSVICPSTPSSFVSGSAPVTIIVGDQNFTATSLFKYKDPIIYSVRNIQEKSNYEFNTGGGEAIYIVGDNFGGPSYEDLKLQVFIGKYECSDCQITSHERIMCSRSPPGIGANLTVSVVINDKAWSSNGSLSYAPPELTQIEPYQAPIKGNELLLLRGKHFGAFFSQVFVNLVPEVSQEKSYSCLNATWLNASLAACNFPSNLSEYGNYLVVIIVGNQKSVNRATTKVSFNRLKSFDPPIALDHVYSVADMQDSLIQLNSTDASESRLEYRIAIVPKHGKIYNYGEGSVGDELNEFNNKVSDPFYRVKYRPSEDIYHPSDWFTFTVTNGYLKSVKDGNVSLAVQFNNSAPQIFAPDFESLFISQKNLDVPLPIVLPMQIKDRDESGHFLIEARNISSARGIWSLQFGGNSPERIDITMPFKIPASKAQSFQLSVVHDDKGGAYPYSQFSLIISDSFGLAAQRVLNVKILVKCNIGYANGLWLKAGDVCTDCPDGAICSADGSHNISNKDGYFALNSRYCH